ncbi:sirohydrochlorin chelatase [Egbenema bharatensis]|uniref:sirohydrochlorin chelatase n=1 Tax=Egbenema bharatensis TaxID=3463334 RepID=UPI003A8C07E9
MKPSSAYLLVSHGSRDPRPQIAIEHLAKLVAQRLSGVGLSLAAAGTGERSGSLAQAAAIPVGTAVLELGPLPLHQQIQNFARTIAAQGYQQLHLVPLFLLPGVHVMEDIPQEVRLAQSALPADLSDLTVQICPYIGCHPQLKHLLINPIDPIATSSNAGKILLAHGSRRPKGNVPVESIAADLNALPAYWSVPPNLETQLSRLIKQGYQQIAILSYFLFEGGITDAIAQAVDRLTQQYPYGQIQLGQPIGATPALADLIVEIIAAE